MRDTPRTKSFMQSLKGYSSSFELFCERVEEFASTLEQQLTAANNIAYQWQEATKAHLKDKDQLRADIAELNERLIDRQQTVMALGVKLMEIERRLAKYEKA